MRSDTHRRGFFVSWNNQRILNGIERGFLLGPQIMSTEFTKTVRGDSLLERLSIQSMVVLLKIEGNCSCLRAKVAHMLGHLPAVSKPSSD
jgi:hypothetical protein